MHAARVNGVTIHYADEGDRGGRPVVFANSLGTDFRVWDRLVGLMPEEMRLIRFDKRGHGLSEAPPAPYRMEDLADDLAGLLDRMELKGAVVVGLSIGGLIAQMLAARRPELVGGIVLMDTAAKIGDPEMWNERIAKAQGEGIGAMADAVMERWFSAAFRANRTEELTAWRNMLTRTPAEGYAGCCAAIRDADLREAAGRISVPVLAMAGDEDGSTPPELVKATADLIPGARFEVVSGAGHLPCVEQPAACASMILGFMEEAGLV
ncbi:MAG: 3-oxoadipate enol-lactonase [Pseudomonadota bacterium]